MNVKILTVSNFTTREVHSSIFVMIVTMVNNQKKLRFTCKYMFPFEERKGKNMEEYIKRIEQIAARCTESQSDGYSQIMRICDAMREEQRYCLGYVSKEEIKSPQFD